MGDNSAGADKKSWFGNQISWLSFLFSILVIWVHSRNAELFLGQGEQAYQVESWERILADTIGQIAVPGFFMVSAYLFYRNFSWDRLPVKWKSRVKTILLPYLLWNFLYYMGYLFITRIKPFHLLVGKGPIPFGLNELLAAVFRYRYNPVFWYLYQLILLILLAPVLYVLLKRTWTGCVFLLVVLLALWKNVSLPLLNLDALFYYSVSGFMALHRQTFAAWLETAPKELERPWLEAVRVGILFLLWCLVWLLGREGAPFYQIPLYTVLVRFLGVVSVVFLVRNLPLPTVREWMKDTFFLYAIHFAWVRLFNKILSRLFPFPAAAFFIFLIMPALMLAVNVMVSSLLRRFVPKLYAVLSGGR